MNNTFSGIMTEIETIKSTLRFNTTLNKDFIEHMKPIYKRNDSMKDIKVKNYYYFVAWLSVTLTLQTVEDITLDNIHLPLRDTTSNDILVTSMLNTVQLTLLNMLFEKEILPKIQEVKPVE